MEVFDSVGLTVGVLVGVDVGVCVLVGVAVGLAVSVWATAFSMSAWEGPQAHTTSDTKIKADTVINIFLFIFPPGKLS